MIRHFEFVGGSSAKFWEVRVRGATVTVRYGRLGTEGQTKNTGFTDPGTAQKHADALIAQKIRKGYRETAAAV
jgi:predicted DNA-binding WGR domain protein